MFESVFIQLLVVTPNDVVNGMTGKIHIWLTTLPLSFFVISTALANEPKINEHKDNRTGDTISIADNVRHADRRITIDVDTIADNDRQQADRSFGEPDYYMQMDQRRELFLKQVEERKQLMDRIRDEHRKAAEKRRNTRLQQMNQTCTKTASADKA